jgi:ATP-dependent exoDNAse (exonuclease V) alpha subunit
MSIRLSWHSDGWNGRICSSPADNTYCVGPRSYPGDLIAENRDTEREKTLAGQLCGYCGAVADDYLAPCCLSINAFGSQTVRGFVNIPEWMRGQADNVHMNIPPATTYTWNYEVMYDDVVKETADEFREFSNDARLRNAERYFESFEPDKSLLFYYANYSNPFSDDENNNYIVVGLSRLKEIGDYLYFPNASERIRRDYANGLVWQKPVTSHFPLQGFRIPYDRYFDDEQTLERIAFIPRDHRPFKFGSRSVSDDEAIQIISRFIEIVDVLIEIDDDSDNWHYRREWLGTLLTELWESRGAYPGMPAVLTYLNLTALIPEFKKAAQIKTDSDFYDEILKLFSGEKSRFESTVGSALSEIKKTYVQLTSDQQEFLLKIAPRFSLSIEQLRDIVGTKRHNLGIKTPLQELIRNPYAIAEEYVPEEPDEYVSAYLIDNGVLPFPGLSIGNLLSPLSAERLRAFTVMELNVIAAHSFVPASSLLERINSRMGAMPEWKSAEFAVTHFENPDNSAVLKYALHLQPTTGNNRDPEFNVYLKNVWEDERLVERTVKEIASRLEDPPKSPLTPERFAIVLRGAKGGDRLNEAAPEEYRHIIEAQARLCAQIFLKPICVISGAAGTGKTTLLKALIENIKHEYGEGTAIVIMTPTGKATERVKQQTDRPATTIHSFIAKNGWINSGNYMLRRAGGKKSNAIDVLIIDECSMIDLDLFATLIRSINLDKLRHLILVGDPNQLPPIGRGRVFYDIITWLRENHPNFVGILTENVRQLSNRIYDRGSSILELAQAFIQEKTDTSSACVDFASKDFDDEAVFDKVARFDSRTGYVDKDLSVYYWHDTEQLHKLIEQAILYDMADAAGHDEGPQKPYLLWDEVIRGGPNGERSAKWMQLISPYRGERYGTDDLNAMLQALLNGAWSQVSKLDHIAIGDKVIQSRNRTLRTNPAYAYSLKEKRIIESDIYNGEIGFVKPHNFDLKNKVYLRSGFVLKRFQVQFSEAQRSDLLYCYGKDLGKDSNGRYIQTQDPAEWLELAYAISVHKAQGSEFDRVYLVLPERQSHLMSMELLYTAITRAQRHLTIFVQGGISTLRLMSQADKSSLRRINSSLFAQSLNVGKLSSVEPEVPEVPAVPAESTVSYPPPDPATRVM